ncbi:NKAP family protein UM04995-like [Mizuhopecten yessoensis]|uniref:NKAP family protein UM04995-like n=1 Tax=Mizuhopecten yessoensis TaxID=6573 RepID=UPI000B45A588|nr:NKAP family protein UM04995-like [Mizuhopecten yessoensis]
MASQSAERTIEVEQDSASDSTDDDSQSTGSDGDEVITPTQYPCPAQWTCPALVQQCPYHHPVHSHRSPTKRGRHHGKNRDKENHGERRHGHGRPNAPGHEHSDAQGEDSTEGHRHEGEGRHRQSEDHHHGSKGHRHGSNGHHRGRGQHRRGDGHRSRHGPHGGRRHGRRRGSCSSEDGSDLIFKCVDVQDFKQQEVKVTVSDDTVKVKAVNDSGEISRVFKVTKDYDISKMRVSRSRFGVLTVAVPPKDSGENVKQDTSKK